MPGEQGIFRFGHVPNLGLFSNHCLSHRLSREPDWKELESPARLALEQLAELWKEQQVRVEKYGDEQGLEEAFIQTVG